ncbi:MAG TPA: TetR/AcrR family transcriptional regulator, partial [Thermoanaerobaculia bacterium]|nr:TetR/AcrR family transcriptional regulator [Thermoanaerobaculia bacterium]
MSRPAATDTLERTGKRERILRAAVEVFAESGYFNSKVSAIAKAAGVADGTIYLYFSGKEDLLVTIFRDQMNAFLMLLDQELSKESDPAGRLRKLVEVHLRASGQDRDLAIVFQVELRHTLKFMSLFSHEALADYLQLIRALIEQGQREGSFRAEIH